MSLVSDETFRHVAAVLLVDGRYVLQLRDNKPGIRHPGVWALFGGAVEPGESFTDAIHREIQEELDLRLTTVRSLGTYDYQDECKKVLQVAVFESDISSQWGHHRVLEGQAAAHFAFAELATLPMPEIVRVIIARHQANEPLPSAAG